VYFLMAFLRMTKMRICLKVFSLLIEKKVAGINGDKLKSWEYGGMIKRHVETCFACRKFLEGISDLEGISEKSKILDADLYQITK